MVSLLIVDVFEEASRVTIAAENKVCRISDRDLALFERVAIEPRHAGKFRSADRFLPDGSENETNGGWWVLSITQAVSPVMLGASRWNPPDDFEFTEHRNQTPSTCPDSLAALNDFFIMLFGKFGYIRAYVGGYFGVSGTLTMGPAGVRTSNGVDLSGTMVILALKSMEKLVVVRNLGSMNWNGGLWAGGLGDLQWKDRQVALGIVFEGNSSYASIDHIRVAGFAYSGLLFDGRRRFSAHFLEIGLIESYGCGSGPVTRVAGAAHTAEFTIIATTGGINTTGQRTTLRVGDNLPAYVAKYVDPDNPQAYCRIWERLYQIKSFDPVKKTITIFPGIEVRDPQPKPPLNLEYIFGGGVCEVGGDAGQIHIGSLVPTDCGVGYNTFALYPAVINALTCQFCGVGILYRGEGGSQLGGVIEYAYFETNYCDIAAFNAAGFDNKCTIVSANPLTLAKVATPGRWAGDPEMDITGLQLGLLRILNVNGEPLANNGEINNEQVVYADGRRGVSPALFHGDSLTIALAALDSERWRLSRINRAMIVITGSGNRSEPLGVVTLTPPTGKTINGGLPGVALSYSSNKLPLQLLIEADPSTGNFFIRRMRPPTASGWSNATGTASRAGFDSSSVTLPQLAERMKALIDDLMAQGSLGP